jgi:hypothetical protein
MSLSKKLLKQANEIRASSPSLVAIDMLKQAGVAEDVARAEIAQSEMEKSAASAMSATGIDYDEALKLVKAAGVKLSDLASYQPTKSVEETLWESLTKMASEAKALEDELESIRTEALGYEARVESLEKVAERREDTTDPVARLAQSGDFTNADLEALLTLDTETLTKVAAMADNQPWSMGRVSGKADVSAMDPLTAFCLGV